MSAVSSLVVLCEQSVCSVTPDERCLIAACLNCLSLTYLPWPNPCMWLVSFHQLPKLSCAFTSYCLPLFFSFQFSYHSLSYRQASPDRLCMTASLSQGDFQNRANVFYVIDPPYIFQGDQLSTLTGLCAFVETLNLFAFITCNSSTDFGIASLFYACLMVQRASELFAMAATAAPTDARTWLNWALLERRRDHYQPARKYAPAPCLLPYIIL